MSVVALARIHLWCSLRSTRTWCWGSTTTSSTRNARSTSSANSSGTSPTSWQCKVTHVHTRTKQHTTAVLAIFFSYVSPLMQFTSRIPPVRHIYLCHYWIHYRFYLVESRSWSAHVKKKLFPSFLAGLSMYNQSHITTVMVNCMRSVYEQCRNFEIITFRWACSGSAQA